MCKKPDGQPAWWVNLLPQGQSISPRQVGGKVAIRIAAYTRPRNRDEIAKNAKTLTTELRIAAFEALIQQKRIKMQLSGQDFEAWPLGKKDAKECGKMAARYWSGDEVIRYMETVVCLNDPQI